MDTHLLLSLFHIFAVVPFFLFIALNRAATSTFVFQIAFVIGVVILLYHAYKAFLKWKAGSQSLWINLLHFLWVGPLLIYIGYQKQNTPRAGYELLALTGFGALGYHTYNLIQALNLIDSPK